MLDVHKHKRGNVVLLYEPKHVLEERKFLGASRQQCQLGCRCTLSDSIRDVAILILEMKPFTQAFPRDCVN